MMNNISLYTLSVYSYTGHAVDWCLHKAPGSILTKKCEVNLINIHLMRGKVELQDLASNRTAKKQRQNLDPGWSHNSTLR